MTQIALGGIVILISGMLLREAGSKLHMLVSIAGTAFLFFLLLDELTDFISQIRSIGALLPTEFPYLSALLKMTGLTFLAEFTSALCKDSGFSAIALQIETAGRICILLVGMPILLTLLTTISTYL